mmetsp:Transcript_18995/g.54253  ORF Transcript_18995/g.54253 Transcript_18995/m.54253 type:complete len:224 (-) Transcript_18995:818-1489(-)
MQMIGVAVVLINLINAAEPPLSDADSPSTSSIITHRLRRWPPFLPKREPQPRASANPPSIDFLLRVSEALYSTTSKPRCSHSNAAIVLLPMPGGPDKSAARADGFCGSCLGLMRFFGSPRWTRSHWSSHFPSFERMSPLPIMSLFCFGLWRSAHNPGAALGLSRGGNALTGGALSLNFASASCRNCLKALAPLMRVVFLSSAARNLLPSSTGRPSSSNSPQTT